MQIYYFLHKIQTAKLAKVHKIQTVKSAEVHKIQTAKSAEVHKIQTASCYVGALRGAVDDCAHGNCHLIPQLMAVRG